MPTLYSLKDKIDYLLNNGYKAVNGRYISPDGSKSFTVKDLLLCWNSLQIF